MSTDEWDEYKKPDQEFEDMVWVKDFDGKRYYVPASSYKNTLYSLGLRLDGFTKADNDKYKHIGAKSRSNTPTTVDHRLQEAANAEQARQSEYNEPGRGGGPAYYTSPGQIAALQIAQEDRAKQLAEDQWKKQDESRMMDTKENYQDKALLLEQKSREFDKALLYGNQYSAAQQEKTLNTLDALAGENRLANEFLGLQSAIPTTQDSFLMDNHFNRNLPRNYPPATVDHRLLQEVDAEQVRQLDALIAADEKARLRGENVSGGMATELGSSGDPFEQSLALMRSQGGDAQYSPSAYKQETNAILNKTYNPPPPTPPEPPQPQNYSPWQSLMDIGSGAKDALSEGYNLFKGNVQDYRQDRSFPSGSIPSLPNIFDATEYVTDNLAGPVDNFLSGSFQGMSDNYANVADSVSGMWGDFTDWMSGGDDEGKVAEETEKERKDAYVEEVRKRYEAAGFDFDYSSRKHAERQYEKDKAQGLL